jgi:hypothetical protein
MISDINKVCADMRDMKMCLKFRDETSILENNRPSYNLQHICKRRIQFLAKRRSQLLALIRIAKRN